MAKRVNLAAEGVDLLLLRLHRRGDHGGVGVQVDGHRVGCDGRALRRPVDEEAEPASRVVGVGRE